jgi:hypothetical protein
MFAHVFLYLFTCNVFSKCYDIFLVIRIKLSFQIVQLGANDLKWNKIYVKT